MNSNLITKHSKDSTNVNPKLRGVELSQFAANFATHDGKLNKPQCVYVSNLLACYNDYLDGNRDAEMKPTDK